MSSKSLICIVAKSSVLYGKGLDIIYGSALPHHMLFSALSNPHIAPCYILYKIYTVYKIYVSALTKLIIIYILVICIVSLALYIVCTSLSIQGECDKLSCSVQMLESELSERTAHCVGLEKQCDVEAENCRLIEVCTVSMLIYCVLPNACTCRPETAMELMIGRQSVRFYAELHNNCHTKLTHVGHVQSKQHGFCTSEEKPSYSPSPQSYVPRVDIWHECEPLSLHGNCVWNVHN